MSNLLETGHFPEDLKGYKEKDYKALSEELRERIVNVVARTGGHLASNLGVVELTMALYSVLDPFKDKIVWDVGHQTYVHKILTGRNDKMETIRSKDGLSGFPKMSESEADSFNTGHSSTSISAALGMCRARDIKGEDYRVCAVIGDGALTGGMAFEALNDAGQSDTNFTVILNDNGMSISQNVGGMSKYLGRIRSKKSYLRAKKGVKKLLVSIPGIGKPMERFFHKIKEAIKALFVDTVVFENFGFEYFGPVDGHDIESMKLIFERAFSYNGPVLVHVVTKKGVGYNPAEENPQSFHGTTPFDPESGEKNKDNSVSFSDTFGKKLCKMAETDKDIVAVTAAMPSGTGLLQFQEKYPDRFFDVGIAEQHAMTMSAGMSAGGLKPYFAVYSTFLQRAYDQVLHDSSIQGLPVVLGVDRAGVCGPDGETHQGIYDLSFLNNLPGVTVAAPSCTEELEMMMDMSLKVFDKDSGMLKGPFAIRYPAKDKYSFDKSYLEKAPLEYGKGVMINYAPFVTFDVAIIAIGSMVETAMNAKAVLKNEGIRALVFNARFLAPLDKEGILNVCKLCGKAISIEDGVKCGGLGSSVTELLQEEKLHIPFTVMGLPDENIPHGKIDEIHKMYKLDAEALCEEARKLVNGKQAE